MREHSRSRQRQAARSRRDVDQAVLELKAHKVALALIERRIADGVARRDQAAHQWLEVLRKAFQPEADPAVVQCNLHALYDQMYQASLPAASRSPGSPHGGEKREPLKPCPMPAEKATRLPSETEAGGVGQVKALVEELRVHIASLQVDLAEVSASHVVMKPNMYFLCACHLGRSMELGRTYADSTRCSFLNDYPRFVVGVWLIILAGMLREAITKLRAGESATVVVALPAAQRPAQRSMALAHEGSPVARRLAPAAAEGEQPPSSAEASEPAEAWLPPAASGAAPLPPAADQADDDGGAPSSASARRPPAPGGSDGSAKQSSPTLLESRQRRLDKDRAKALGAALRRASADERKILH